MAIFMPPLQRYGTLHHFTQQLYGALTRSSIETKLMKAVFHDPGPFLDELLHFNPNYTLSFNGLLPDNKGHFLCDILKIPHIAYLVDFPTAFFPLVNSPNTVIISPDRYGSEFLEGLGASHSLFLPVGVGRTECHRADSPRTIDVLMLASCIDFRRRRKSWPQLFPFPIPQAMENAVAMTLADQETSYIQAFVYALDAQFKKSAPRLDISLVDYPTIFRELELYLKGYERVMLVRSLKDVIVDIYGAADEEASWHDYIAHQPNIRIHDAVDFQGSIELMRQAKIVLSSSPVLKQGAHERVFAALSLGALVLTAENPYLKDQFKDGRSIAFYRYHEWDRIQDKIQYFLTHEDERRAIVTEAQQLIAQNHTWDHRLSTLLERIPT